MRPEFTERPRGLRRWGRIVSQAGVLALMMAVVSPARAANDRAVKSRVAPIYPEIAKRMKITGEVKVQVTVDADGKLTDAKAISGNRILSTACRSRLAPQPFAAGLRETRTRRRRGPDVGACGHLQCLTRWGYTMIARS